MSEKSKQRLALTIEIVLVIAIVMVFLFGKNLVGGMNHNDHAQLEQRQATSAVRFAETPAPKVYLRCDGRH